MIRTVLNGAESSVAAALASHTAITAGESALLNTEVDTDPTGRGYAGKTAAQILVLGAAGYWQDNPTPQGRVAKDYVLQSDLVVLASTVQGRLAAVLLQGGSLPAGIIYLADVVLPSVAKQEANSTTNPEALGMLDALVSAQLLTTDEKEELLTAPDPNWTAQIWHESRWSVVFGANVCPTLAEIQAVL